MVFVTKGLPANMFLFRDWVAGGWGQNQKMMIFFYFDESNKEFPLPPPTLLYVKTRSA